MATKGKKTSKPKPKRQGRNVVVADVVGNTSLPSCVLDFVAHSDATPLHQIPQSDEEIVLSRVENLLGKGPLRGSSSLIRSVYSNRNHSYETMRINPNDRRPIYVQSAGSGRSNHLCGEMI